MYMRTANRKLYHSFLCAVMLASLLIWGCESKKDTGGQLPAIGGFNNANEVAAADLVAYWSFDTDGKESKSSAVPTRTSRATFVADGSPKGNCLKLDSGFLVYAPIAAISSGITSITVSAWVKVANNKDHSSFIFTIGREAEWAGSFNFTAETGWYAATNDTLVVKGLAVIKKQDGTSDWQDIMNAPKPTAEDLAKGHTKEANPNNGKWAHYVLTWDAPTGSFKIYANGKKISNAAWESRNGGQALNLNFFTVKNIIFGAAQTVADGTATDPWLLPMRGSIDEFRIYKSVLSEANIGALYDLEKAGR